jgi:hypothetical protein
MCPLQQHVRTSNSMSYWNLRRTTVLDQPIRTSKKRAVESLSCPSRLKEPSTTSSRFGPNSNARSMVGMTQHNPTGPTAYTQSLLGHSTPKPSEHPHRYIQSSSAEKPASGRSLAIRNAPLQEPNGLEELVEEPAFFLPAVGKPELCEAASTFTCWHMTTWRDSRASKGRAPLSSARCFASVKGRGFDWRQRSGFGSDSALWTLPLLFLVGFRRLPTFHRRWTITKHSEHCRLAMT